MYKGFPAFLRLSKLRQASPLTPREKQVAFEGRNPRFQHLIRVGFYSLTYEILLRFNLCVERSFI